MRSRLNNRHGRPAKFRCLFLVLFALLAGACVAPDLNIVNSEPESGSTGVEGTVLKQDGDVAAGAFVYAYRNASHGLRGPADFGVRVDRNGRYFLDLVEGEYHLVARLRQSGADAGPPRPGDAWAMYVGNPVAITAGQVVNIDFVLQGGSLPRQVRQGSLATGDTGFRGRLVDANGRSFAGAFALAYISPDFHRMPELTSLPADADGRFTLYVPEPGRFCLAARSKTRGQPRTGEPYGILDTDGEPCLEVQAGEIVDVGTIILRPYR